MQSRTRNFRAMWVRYPSVAASMAPFFLCSSSPIFCSSCSASGNTASGRNACPPRYEPLLRVLSFRSNLNYHLVEELDYAVFECLTGVSCPDRNKALDQWLQVSSFRVPDVRRLSLHFVN